MQNLMNDLTKLFQKDERIFADGKLLKNKLTELALKLDQPLIELLLSDNKAKEHFFIEKNVKKGTVLIFDKDKFIAFVNNKEFLPDSFTSFKNKIGLITNSDYLKEKDDVVLAWAYKDCVLEGGQDKEDQKRDEIFYNETLSPDEIDRLFEPKVLTNFKKYDNKGEHDVTSFNIADNLIIKGNNLLILHSLMQKLRKQVKLIYIDPPYNADKEADSFGYNDKFSHSTWLTFMKNRLECAIECLSSDGVLLINIDEVEHAYLNVLCDEIFGKANYAGDLIWKKRKGGGNDSSFLALDHDYILVYMKDSSKEIQKEKWRIAHLEEYLKRYSEIDEEGYRFYWDTLARDGLQNPIKLKIKCPDGSRLKINSQKSENTVKEELANGKIRIIKVNGSWTVHHRVYQPKGQVLRSILDDVGTNKTAGDELKELFGETTYFKHPKPESLLYKLIDLTTKKGDIVLDFFLGSGTTAAVALKMGRRFIGIEQMDYTESLPVARLKKVIKGERGGISKNVKWKGGGSFVYAELMEWNEQYVTEIKGTNTTRKLLNIYERMKKEAFFRYEIDLSKFEVKEFEKLSLKEQKQILCECLDKNHLYVNLSEINDATYKVSADDKKLNKEFYKTVV